jgi:methyl-accepting chemotaxis protein
MGYSLAEIRGQHHRIFLQASDRDSKEYMTFWSELRQGKFQSAEFKRVTKSGGEVWILASYNPILDSEGRPFKVVKVATDVTAQKLSAADDSAQIVAIQRALAVIEFKMDGTIVKANQNFLDAMGYQLEEITGRHHRMCVDPSERDSPEFAKFWADLNKGIYLASEYKRMGKAGREVWIQASYNPVFDLNGRPYKVVKYAADITASVLARKRAERARSMIETVSAGSEEMSASIREISETMVKSRQTADAAVDRVAEADAQASKLTGAAASMGGIVQLIGAITGQINLLALNATIESARAGEAGRGFAVVASEVKNLASQARAATEKITSEIASLNQISTDVVTTLVAIKDAFNQVTEFVTSTAAAVEEQATVIEDMASNMQSAVAELN